MFYASNLVGYCFLFIMTKFYSRSDLFHQKKTPQSLHYMTNIDWLK